MKSWRIGLRGLALTAGYAFPLSLWAQADGWNAFIDQWRKTPRRPATLLAAKTHLPPGYARSDEQILRLSAAGDLSIEPLDGASLEQVRLARGWKEGPRWILLDWKGGILEEGTSFPAGDALRTLLAGSGITPTWDALDRFLRFHPENGRALQRRLFFALRLADLRLRNLAAQGKAEALRFETGAPWPVFVPAKLLDPMLAEEVLREATETLNQLNRLPDPWRMADQSRLLVWLSMHRGIESPDFRDALARLRDATLEAWRRNPHSGHDLAFALEEHGNMLGLGALWLACDAATRSYADLPDLPRLEPSPGRIWPHADLIMHVFTEGFVPERWPAVLDFLDRLPLPPLAPAIPKESWPERLALHSALASFRTCALAELGRWPDAVSALQEFRRLSGKRWSTDRQSLAEQYSKDPKPAKDGGAGAPDRSLPPEAFLAILRQPPLEDVPPPPDPGSLRFLIWGKPDWVSRWPSIRAAAPLIPWGPEELREEVPGEPETTILAQSGFPVEGWAVFRGRAEIVAHGRDVPDPERLALQLYSAAPSKIHILDEFIRLNPDQLDARRDRFAKARTRMPDPALEARMIEDAAAAWLPLDFGPEAPWISDLDGWRLQAKKVVNGLEPAIQRWPSHSGLWRAWISWTAFLPSRPSLVAFASGLSVFGPRGEWMSSLPAAVHREAARVCRESRRFDEMARWFEEAWAGVGSGQRSLTYSDTQASEVDRAIYEGYREALSALGRNRERSELDLAWAARPAKEKAAQNPRS